MPPMGMFGCGVVVLLEAFEFGPTPGTYGKLVLDDDESGPPGVDEFIVIGLPVTDDSSETSPPL